MTQVKTRDNVRFEEPLKQVLSLRLTDGEYNQICVVSLQNNISSSELIRNLIRDHISNYALSENLIKYLHVSSEIDKFLLEKRLVSSRKATNLSKIREILTDFEEFLEQHPKRIDITFALNDAIRINGLIKFIMVTDEWLGSKIDEQVKRIWKSKTYKALEVPDDL